MKWNQTDKQPLKKHGAADHAVPVVKEEMEERERERERELSSIATCRYVRVQLGFVAVQMLRKKEKGSFLSLILLLAGGVYRR